MNSLPAVSVILLLLTTGPLLGWTVPTGSGEIPEAVDEENELDSRQTERPVLADPGVIPLEVTDVEAPLDLDAEPERSSGDDADEEKGEPLDVDEEREEPMDSDEEREGPLDADKERGGPLDADAYANYPRNRYGIFPKLFPDFFKRLIHIDAFDKIDDAIRNFEVNLNEIIRKAMDESIRFNGTTTNSTKVVEDEKGNKFKVDTVIKKGDRNQTMVMEIVESVPPTTNRTTRSNWLAEPIQ